MEVASRETHVFQVLQHIWNKPEMGKAVDIEVVGSVGTQHVRLQGNVRSESHTVVSSKMFVINAIALVLDRIAVFLVQLLLLFWVAGQMVGPTGIVAKTSDEFEKGVTLRVEGHWLIEG